MIRLEVALKNNRGYESADLEKVLKRALVVAVADFAVERAADVTRIQFLGPKVKR